MPGSKFIVYKPAKKKSKDAKQDRQIALLKRRMPRIEKKYIDNYIVSQKFNTSFSFKLLNAVTQGDDYDNREGKRCHFFRLELAGTLNTRSVTGGSAVCRMMIIQDKQANEAVFSTADLLTDQNDIFSLYDPVYAKRFKVLYDKIIDLNSQAANSANLTYRTFRRNKKISVDTSYVLSGGTIADIVTNSIYLVYGSNIASGTDDSEGSAQVRLWFTDV